MDSNTRKPALTFGQILTKQMELLNYSPRVLAKKARTNEETVRAWQRNEYYPDEAELSRLCLILGRMRHFTGLIPKGGSGKKAAPVLTLVPKEVVPDPPKPAPKPVEPPAVVTRVEPAAPEVFTTFREAIRTVLRREGAKNQVAELLDITVQRISWWEIGLNTPTPEQYEQLCTLFPELRNAPCPSSLRKEPAKPKRKRAPAKPAPKTAPPVVEPVIEKGASFTLVKHLLHFAGNKDLIAFLTEARQSNLSIEDVIELLRG